MNILDLILIGAILLFGLLGFRKGFIQTIGGIVGVVVATVLAGKYFLLAGNFFGSTNLANVVAFLAIFSITIKLVGLAFWALGKLFRVISILPFVKTFDRALGTVLGLAQGILILSVVMFFLTKFPLNPWLEVSMQGSLLTDVLITISIILTPLLPEALKTLKGII